MTDYRYVSFHELCRVCTANSDQKVNVFSADGRQKNLSAKIADCLSLHIEEKDRLPKVVCQHCLDQVDQIYEFRNVCRNSQTMLANCLNTATQQSSGKVYIQDAIATGSGKSLSVVGSTGSNAVGPALPQLTTMSLQSLPAQSVQLQGRDLLNSIMQAVGMQQLPDNADKPAMQQYTITVDNKGLKTEPVEYKIESVPATSQQMQRQQSQQQQVQRHQNAEKDADALKEFLKMKPNIKVTPVKNHSHEEQQQQQQQQQQQHHHHQQHQQPTQQIQPSVLVQQQDQLHQQQLLQSSVASLCLQQLQQQLQQFQQQQQLQQFTSQLQPQPITIAASSPASSSAVIMPPSDLLSPSKSKKPKLNFVLTSPSTSQTLSSGPTPQQPQIQLQLLPAQSQQQQNTATLLSSLLQQQQQQAQQHSAIGASASLLGSPNKCYLPITIKDENSDQQIVAHIDAKNFVLPTYQLQMKLQPQIATVDGQPVVQLAPTSIPATLQLTPQSLANQTFQALAGSGGSPLVAHPTPTLQQPQQQVLKTNVQVTSQQIIKNAASSLNSSTNDAATSTHDPLEDFTPSAAAKSIQQQSSATTNNNNNSQTTIKSQKYRLTQHPGSDTIEIMPTTNFTQQIMQQVQQQQQQKQRQQQLQQRQQQQLQQAANTVPTTTAAATNPQHGGITVQRITSKEALTKLTQATATAQAKLAVLNKNNVTISRITPAQQQQQQQEQLLPTKMPQKPKLQMVAGIGGEMQKQPEVQQQQQQQLLKVSPTKKMLRKPLKTTTTTLTEQHTAQQQQQQQQEQQPQHQLLPTVKTNTAIQQQQQQEAQQAIAAADLVVVKADFDVAAAPAANTSATNNNLKCHLCGRVFKKKEHLTQHVKLHAGLRPFKCYEELCDKAFSRKEHLMRHLVSHTGKKMFICDLCSKPFSRKDNLNKHRRIHTGQPNASNYICDVCNKPFAVKAYYEQHKQIHVTSEAAESVAKIEKQSLQEAPSSLKPNRQIDSQQQAIVSAALPTLQQQQQHQQQQQQQIQIIHQQQPQAPQQQQQIMHLQLPSVVTTQDLAGNTITITQTHDAGLKATLSSHDGTLLERMSFSNLLGQTHFVNPTTGQIMGPIKIEK